MGSRAGVTAVSTISSVSSSGASSAISMAGKADPYADIDFDDITEQTNLANDEIECLKVCFDLFDTKKVDFLSADDLGEIMRAMGFRPTEEELKDLLAEIDEDGSGEIEFGEFCQLCATFLVEDPDIETMKRELKDAFRIYDKEGLGYITTETLRGLIGELLAPLTDEELDGILEELDEDGSGSMDFDEFCEEMKTLFLPSTSNKAKVLFIMARKHLARIMTAILIGYENARGNRMFLKRFVL